MTRPVVVRRKPRSLTTTAPAARVAHLHCTRSRRWPRSNARSYLACSVSGRSTVRPSRVASAAMANSATAPLWFVDPISTNTCSHHLRTDHPPSTLRPHHGRAPLRPSHHRAQVAGGVGARVHVGGLERGRRPRSQVV